MNKKVVCVVPDRFGVRALLQTCQKGLRKSVWNPVISRGWLLHSMTCQNHILVGATILSGRRSLMAILGVLTERSSWRRGKHAQVESGARSLSLARLQSSGGKAMPQNWGEGLINSMPT